MRKPVIKNTQLKGVVNKLLHEVIGGHQFVVLPEFIFTRDSSEHETHHAYVGLHHKWIVEMVSLHNSEGLIEITIVGYIERFWVRFRRKLGIHLSFAFAFKASKGERRIGCGKEPERPGFDTVPQPNGHYGNIFAKVMPGFPPV